MIIRYSMRLLMRSTENRLWILFRTWVLLQVASLLSLMGLCIWGIDWAFADMTGLWEQAGLHGPAADALTGLIVSAGPLAAFMWWVDRKVPDQAA